MRRLPVQVLEVATALLDVAVRDTSTQEHPAVDGIVSELYPYQVIAPAAGMHAALSCICVACSLLFVACS